jgi:hypothetical protein
VDSPNLSNGRACTDHADVLVEKLARLKEVMDERDRLYSTQFKSAETAVSAALAAQEKATSAAFAASEKAVLKAENAQADYNTRSNEFRGQLDDQAKTLMPRLEVNTMMRAMEEKLETIKAGSSKDIDILRQDIRSLRESRSEAGGKDIAREAVHQQSNWSTGILVVIFLSLISSAISIAAAIAYHYSAAGR